MRIGARLCVMGWMAACLLSSMSFFSTDVFAKAWQGAEPGQTTREQLFRLFGPPTRVFSKGGQLSEGITYQKEQAIQGAREANFYFDKNGILSRIDVFPSKDISPEEIVSVFGKNYTERITKTGNSYYNYAKDGMVVFFDKDNTKVLSFLFTKPSDSTDGGIP
jgi:hypothetical protein